MMTRDLWLELERLAHRYSVEIVRQIPYMTEGEALGHLRYLRRIANEQAEGHG